MKVIESTIYLWSQSNNSFQLSGIRVHFIENLDGCAVVSRAG